MKFNAEQLLNLQTSLTKEYTIANKTGAFASSTIVNLNTRKYHGLLICNLDKVDGGNHLLLSAVDETIVKNDTEFHLAARQYPSSMHSGYKFLTGFDASTIPIFTYKVDDVVLQKEILLAANDQNVLIKYTLLDADETTTIKLHPFTANRNIHQLQKAHELGNNEQEDVKNGIKIKLQDNYPYLFMQTSSKSTYTHMSDWFYNVEYEQEINRGYEGVEDLYVPGYFQFKLKKGESIVFSASLKEMSPANLKRKFTAELKKQLVCNNFESCMLKSANQFIIEKNKKPIIVSNFPWLNVDSRDSFIALPGLLLSANDKKTVIAFLTAASKNLKNGLFMQNQSEDEFKIGADTSLWYIWAIQQYAAYTNEHKAIWKDLGSSIKSIIDNYKKGTKHNIAMHKNGLIYAGDNDYALTWMNGIVNNKPVTQRAGYAVEINALWYNALLFAIELAEKSGDTKFVNKWKKVAELTKKSFINTFWDDNKAYLADYVNDEHAVWDVRPNQIIAASLPYCMIDDKQINAVIEIVEKELLTTKGLRSLSVDNKDFIGEYKGNHCERELAYYQGSVHPWLISHFAEAYLKTNKKSGTKFVKKLYEGFAEEINDAGLGSISELFDGNEPFNAGGAVSHAKSVAEVLRLKMIIDSNK